MAALGTAVKHRVVQEEITVQQSTTLMKNLMRTAVSTITYMRNLFPEDCFQDNKLTGITIKTLLPKKPEARLLINWLEKGVFDALDKQYLTDVIFAIYTRNSDRNTLLECYQFHMDYPAPVPPAGAQTEGQGGGAGAAGDINSPAPIPTMSLTHSTESASNTTRVFTREEIRDSTVRLIRTLVTLTQTLKQLPRQRFLTIKLQYRDDVTPPEYEPAFFRAGTAEDEVLFESRPARFKVGDVATRYHEIVVKMKSVADTYSPSMVRGEQQQAKEHGESAGDVSVDVDGDAGPLTGGGFTAGPSAAFLAAQSELAAAPAAAPLREDRQTQGGAPQQRRRGRSAAVASAGAGGKSSARAGVSLPRADADLTIARRLGEIQLGGGGSTISHVDDAAAMDDSVVDGDHVAGVVDGATFAQPPATVGSLLGSQEDYAVLIHRTLSQRGLSPRSADARTHVARNFPELSRETIADILSRIAASAAASAAAVPTADVHNQAGSVQKGARKTASVQSAAGARRHNSSTHTAASTSSSSSSAAPAVIAPAGVRSSGPALGRSASAAKQPRAGHASVAAAGGAAAAGAATGKNAFALRSSQLGAHPHTLSQQQGRLGKAYQAHEARAGKTGTGDPYRADGYDDADKENASPEGPLAAGGRSGPKDKLSSSTSTSTSSLTSSALGACTFALLTGKSSSEMAAPPVPDGGVAPSSVAPAKARLATKVATIHNEYDFPVAPAPGSGAAGAAGTGVRVGVKRGREPSSSLSSASSGSSSGATAAGAGYPGGRGTITVSTSSTVSTVATATAAAAAAPAAAVRDAPRSAGSHLQGGKGAAAGEDSDDYEEEIDDGDVDSDPDDDSEYIPSSSSRRRAFPAAAGAATSTRTTSSRARGPKRHRSQAAPFAVYPQTTLV